MIEEFSLTQEELGKRLGKSRPYIANTLRLLTLSTDLQDLIRNNQLSPGHGRALLSIEDPKVRDQIAKKVMEEKLSVRDLERLVQNLKKKKKVKRTDNTRTKSPFIIELEENLQRILGTKVNIHRNRNKKGKIEIEYYSDEDLERILDLISTR